MGVASRAESDYNYSAIPSSIENTRIQNLVELLHVLYNIDDRGAALKCTHSVYETKR